ncbi:unnamed protein product, partial [Brachionus calyciflorus]
LHEIKINFERRLEANAITKEIIENVIQNEGSVIYDKMSTIQSILTTAEDVTLDWCGAIKEGLEKILVEKTLGNDIYENSETSEIRDILKLDGSERKTMLNERLKIDFYEKKRLNTERGIRVNKRA